MNANRFTEKLQEALGRAQNAALSAHNQAVDVEHLLASLLEDNEGLASSILKLTGVDRDAVSRKLSAELAKIPHVTGGGADSGQIYAAQRLGRVLARAEQEAGKLKDEYVSVEHVLIAMLDEPGAASKILREAGLTHDKLMAVLKKVRGNQRVTSSNPEATYQSLEKYGRDLTKLAAAGKIDPVIGRDEEIRRVIQVLSRRTKNNPVLIGEPGVGKTAIVEGLARRIVAGRRARGTQESQAGRARHGRADCRREVPRRVRGTAQGGAEGSAGSRGRDNSVHRRAAYRRRRRRGRRRDGCVESAQADAGARRTALHRRDHARRVPQIYREGRRARAPLPARDGRGAERRGHYLDSARAQGTLRSPSRNSNQGRRAGHGRGALETLHHRSIPARQGDRPGR